MEYVTVGGAEVPAIGFGTSRITGEECATAVESALDLGYRHIDTAQLYDNEAAVGEGIERSGVDESEVFLTTKLRGGNLAREDVFGSFAESRERLGVETVDLLLIHATSDSAPIAETVGAMNDLQTEGVVEHIGVSNFDADELRTAIEASETPIVTNQVKYHPFYDQSELLELCAAEDVMLTAYSPLGKGKVSNDETLAAIGDRYGKTASQVALRWLIQQENVSAIPKAENPDHRRQNIDVFDFELTGEEMGEIFDLQGGLTTRIKSALGI